MMEWHVLPEHITHCWTPMLLHRMVMARNKRIERLNAAISGESYQPSSSGGEVRMTDTELFNAMGINLQKTGNA
jgi:hypothetical protein